MRTAFFEALAQLAGHDDRVNLIVGDLGFGATNDFIERFPDRYFNAGVAEQNMTGMATGMALSGSMVFTYSIANFPTLRCLEQIRNDVCYHNANVKIVSVGAGFSYGPLGVSHHLTEDVAILRPLPNLLLASPGDPVEARAVTLAAGKFDGPAYLRFGRAGDPVVHSQPLALPPGTSIQLREGTDVTLMVTGGLLPTAVAASESLAASGVGVRLVSMPWISPLDEEAVRRAGMETGLVVTLEEHSVIGGLGGAVCEILASVSQSAPVVRIGLPHSFTCAVGDQDYLRHIHGLTPQDVVGRIGTALKEHGVLARSLR